MFQATRRRLALWYTTITAILLLVFATGVYLYVRTTLIDRIDDTLNHVIEVVNRSLVIQQVPVSEGRYWVNVEASFHDNASAVEDDHIDLEWFDSQGQLIWSTFSEPLSIPLHPNRNGKTVYLSRDHLLRQVTERVEINHHVLGYLRVSHPWFEVTKPIRQLFLDLTIGTSLMVICVAAMGWFLSGIAIQPVIESYQSLKQFTADASHELRNPIAMIQTNVEMALAYPEAEPQLQQRQLRVIERLTQRLGNLVNDLLFLARSDSGIIQPNYKPVPLDALLIEVIEEQRIYAQQKEIFLSLHLVEPQDRALHVTDEVFTLQGDWDQLARLFTNLISNALEHTGSNAKKNSDLNFQPEQEQKNTRENLQSPSVEIQLKQVKRERQTYLQVKVKDTGNGIPDSALAHIFDRFYRVDPSRYHNQNGMNGGTGLGLAIARAIVENHHGQITVESILHQGTTFTVVLPVNPTVSTPKI
ncbi:sensor histidine kinase [Gloeothece verrucosa]|uniref:histidine kinase n=1 Tax=Gloeothece verrucosa (strain PCC 7822) TaxID=497965 RepID=E0U7R7_GLOV7|nr:HAMP domain-containing sensor histidine kinase [Gloeothece verrucosa]ADN14879.1 integral membrane sensor signal transduction histidine kinase [Gloeothece verrucosa PCC 7822]